MFNISESSNETRVCNSDDPSVMYKFVTRLGLSFEYYDLYDNVKNEYDKCVNKVFYHFHQAFANAGGDADNIKLPREISPEQVTFARYLILNQLKDAVSDIMVKGTEKYNAGHYADSPVIFDGRIAKFATSNAYRDVDNAMVELRITDGDSTFYHTIDIDHPEKMMTELLKGFTEAFTNGRFAILAAELTKDLNFKASDQIRQNYQESVKALKEQLNEDWAKADKGEKDTISHILRIINEKLDTVGKFLSNK